MLDTNAASVYNPYNYPASLFGDPGLAIDNEESTAWTAQVQAENAPKMAEGLLLDLKNGRNETLGRTSSRQVTCFLNPLGLGYQFAAVGAIIYKRAREKDVGLELPTDWFTQKEIP